jgi:serine/threonine protein kinase
MQPPLTVDDLLLLLEKSRLVDAARLEVIRQKLASAPPALQDPHRLADQLVRQHWLTRFQADQILQGRSKGFWVKRYKILDQVGIGGMARVFLAEHAIMRRKVALKILPTSKCADPPSLARFLREARAIASINHPNVIRAYDIDQDADFYYIVLEYAEGLTVAQHVERHGPIPWPQACDYVYQAAAGCEHLLACGLIHRDIKPSNIIIEHGGAIKLVDLGLAVFLDEKETDPLTVRYEQNALGTADYLSPEQVVDSHNVDGRADIYSLGATFCFMLSGKPPFPDGTVMEKLHAHQTQPFETIRDRAPDVPKDLDAILRKMLAKKAADRFATMTALRSALRRFRPVNSVSAQLSGTFAMISGQVADARQRTDGDSSINLAGPHPGKPGSGSQLSPKSDVRLATPAKPPETPASEPPINSNSDAIEQGESTPSVVGRQRRLLLGSLAALLAVGAAASYYFLT